MNTKGKLLTASCLIFLLGGACARYQENHASGRDLASTKSFMHDLQKAQQDFASASIAEEFSAENCEVFLEKHYKDLFDFSGKYYLPEDETQRRMLLHDTPQVIQQIFNLQLIAQDRFRKLEVEKVSIGCRQQMQRFIRSGRILSEYFAQWFTKNTGYQVQSLDENLSSTQWSSNPKFPQRQVLSGDIILASNNSVANSLLNRLGDETGHFSHMGIVWIDAKNVRHVISSDIASGIKVYAWEEFLAMDFQRLAIYRHLGSDVAINAAKVAKKAMDSYQHIGELIAHAFGSASNGTIMIPSYRTTLAPIAHHEQLNDLANQAEHVFNPDDLEIDPNFILTAEWKNFSAMGEVHTHDAIIAAILGWMTEKDYHLVPPVEEQLKAKGRKMAKMIFNWETGVVPKEVRSSVTGHLWQVEKIYQILSNYLQEFNRQFVEEHGRDMTLTDMSAALEAIRLADCQIHLQNASNLVAALQERGPRTIPLFHYKINPKKNNCD